jgi:tetratricopeptide (TPR) repeat protein
VSDNPRIDDLRRRVEKDPASIAFAQLGEEYRRIGRFKEAVETCRAGLARHPAYLSARVTLGRALLGRGDLDEAEQEMTVVLRSAPENLAALRALAEIEQRRGNLPGALRQYEVTLEHAPHDPDLERIVADLRRQLDAAWAAATGPAAGSRAAGPAAAAIEPPGRSPKPTRVLGPEFAVLPVLEQWLEAILADRQARALGRWQDREP